MASTTTHDDARRRGSCKRFARGDVRSTTSSVSMQTRVSVLPFAYYQQREYVSSAPTPLRPRYSQAFEHQRCSRSRLKSERDRAIAAPPPPPIEHRAQQQNEGEFYLAVFYPRLRVISAAEKVEKCITDFIPYILGDLIYRRPCVSLASWLATTPATLSKTTHIRCPSFSKQVQHSRYLKPQGMRNVEKSTLSVVTCDALTTEMRPLLQSGRARM